jgi:hypothetical protein
MPALSRLRIVAQHSRRPERVHAVGVQRRRPAAHLVFGGELIERRQPIPKCWPISPKDASAKLPALREALDGRVEPQHLLARRRTPEGGRRSCPQPVGRRLPHVLRSAKPHTELGVDYFNNLDAAHLERPHVRRLE